MSDEVILEIFDRKTGDRRIEHVDLPVEFGKSPAGASRIVFPVDRQTISRSHGRLERQGEALTYVDTSSNGSTVAGQKIQGSQRQVSLGDLIVIEDYEIRLSGRETITLKLTGINLEPFDDVRVAADETCYLVRSDGKITLRTEKDSQSDDETILEFTSDGTAMTVERVADDSDGQDLKVNNRIVNVPARANPGDVVSIGSSRIEVLQGGVQKIVCGNPSCRLLNDLPFEGNCVWCGYYLAASGSFTRVTPP